MENTFKADIGIEEIIRQNEQEGKKKFEPKVGFDKKNYLDTRLKDNEAEKTLTIRLLPFSPEGGLPFQKVYMHTVRVNPEMSQSGWKSFVCLQHNKHINKPCPYCQLAEQTKELKLKEFDEVKRKQLRDIEFINKAKDMWIVRCIDRDNEADGVKFWLMSNVIYEKIYNIFTRRLEKARKQGKEYNVFSLVEGKDLEVTISRNGNKTNIDIVDADERTPLSTNIELANSWITDTKKWTDVYTEKPYEYLSIVLQGKVPFYDKDKQCYVAKLSADEYKEQQESETKPISEEFSKSSDEKDDLPF